MSKPIEVHVVQRNRARGTYTLYMPGFATHLQERLDRGEGWWRGDGTTHKSIEALVDSLMAERGVESYSVVFWSEERASEAPAIEDVI